MNPSIRSAMDTDADVVSKLISRSFADVALRFALTRENCPKHPSNCTAEWVREDQRRGVAYFIAEQDGLPVGCVAMERASATTCYLERLAVLPDRRRSGIGGALVDHVVKSAKAAGVHRVSISIIAKHVELREWYRRLGFGVGATKRFAHLPFEVLFMEMDTNKAASNSVQPTAAHTAASSG